MRSIPLLAATTVIALGAWACGDDGGGVGPGTDPVASFTAPACTVNVACPFTDASNDPNGTITTWSWNFGDGTPADPNKNPTHTYSTAGSFTVTLTVTDNSGATDTDSKPVTVTAGTGNTPPTASFVPPLCTVGAACAFTDGSSDPDGTIAGWSWNFGDGTLPDINQHPTHTFVTAGTFNVMLTVTDNLGATNSITQPVTVSQATSGDCTPVGTTDLICNLTLAQRSTVTITLDSEDCELGGNRVFIPAPEPRAQNVFTNVCSQPVIPVDYTLLDPAGLPLVFEAGTVLPVQFHRGEPGVGDPPAGTPAGTLESTSANNWTISIDDGGDIATPRDFTDVLLTVVATPQ